LIYVLANVTSQIILEENFGIWNLDFGLKEMADEKWQKVRKIFDSALRRKPEERRNYLI